MKSLITELRLYFAELLLGLVLKVAPFGKEGETIKVMIVYYFDGKVREHKTKKL